MFPRRENRRRRSLRERLRDGCERCVALGRRVGPWFVLAAVAVGIPALLYFGYHRIVSSPYFRISNIEIRGDRFAEVERLAQRAHLVHGVNIFEMDPSAAVKSFESSPWVRKVTVDRNLPDEVVVRVEERRPRALVVDDGFHAADGRGRIIEKVDPAQRPRWTKLPLVTGLSTEELDEDRGRRLLREAIRVGTLYEKLGLADRSSLSEIHVDPVLGLTLVTEGTATEIRLGRGKYRSRLKRLKTVRATLDERGIEPSYLLMHRDSLDRVTVGRRTSHGSAGGNEE